MSNPSLDGNDRPWAVSLVRGDLLFRFQRKIGLIPEQGLGVARRALFWSLLAWLPVAAWAWKNGFFLPLEGNEPLLAHFGINARLLLCVPLFIIAEGMMQGTLTALLPRLVSSGVVPPGQLTPASLGGITVKVGDTVMDGSVRKRLGILRSRLTPGLR